jgi:hypothetical protein
MSADLRGLNIPFPPKDHWRAHVLIAVVMFTVLLYGVSADYGKAYLAAALAYLPGLAVFILGGSLFGRLGGSSDLQRIGFWLLVAGYMWLAKSLLFPLALELLDHVVA